MRLIEQDEVADPKDRALARQLRRRAAWWRDRVLATPWYAHLYVETVRFYDIYNFCDDWVAVHCAFGPRETLLEVIDLPSAPPVFFRAPTYEALSQLVADAPNDLAAFTAAQAGAFALPDQWRRLGERPRETRPSNFAALEGRGDGPIWREATFIHPRFTALALTLGDRRVGACDASSGAVKSTPLEAGPAAPIEPGRLIDIAGEEAEPYLADGFSYPLQGVRWTDNLLPTLRFGHAPRGCAAELTLWPQDVWRRGETPARFDILVDGELRTTEMLEAGRATVIAFSPEEMGASAAKSVALRPHDPKRPSDAPTHDHRRLGCALLAMRFAWTER